MRVSSAIYNSYQSGNKNPSLNTAKGKMQQEVFKDILNITFKDEDRDLLRPNATNLFFDGKYRVLMDYDFSKLPSFEVKNNSLNLPIDQPFLLGKFDGHSVAMRILSYGGMENSSNGGIGVLEEVRKYSNAVTPYEELCAKQVHKFSSRSHQQINDKCCLLGYLGHLTIGKKTEKQFNDHMKDFRIDVGKELTNLGIDISKEFSVNGTTLLFKDGKIQFKENL